MIVGHVRFFLFFLAMMFFQQHVVRSRLKVIYGDQSLMIDPCLRTTSSIRDAVQIVATGLRNAFMNLDLCMHPDSEFVLSDGILKRLRMLI